MKTLLLLSALFALLHGSTAWACSCVEEKISEQEKIAKAYKQDALIFTGRVLSAETIVTIDTLRTRTRRAGTDSIYGYQRRELVRYTFAVDRRLKGTAGGPTVQVSAPADEAACGKVFRPGEAYLVHAFVVSQDNSSRPITPYFATGLCTRTKALRLTRRAELRQLARLAARG